MGYTTTTAKEKKETCKVCQLKFITLAGLVSHQNAKHPELKNKDNSTPKANNTPLTRVSKRLKLQKEDAEDIDSDLEIKTAGVFLASKTEFKCPKCAKVFPINFQARKHIEKKHCVDDDGNSVSSDSPDLIKPVPIEKCLSCNKHFDADLNHKCLTESELSNIFHCIGCAHRFGSLDAFNKHVIHVHNDNIDNMFFKTTEEFELWKKRMETIVKHKYLTLSKGTAYKYFTCNFVSPRNTFNTTYLCPSLIMAKYLGTGIQIHYNITHNGHSCPKYIVPQEFSEYMTNKSKILSPFDSLIEKKPPEDIQQEIYKKYFDLMGNIRKDAAKVDTAILKKLFESALKMQALINSSEEDNKEEDALFSKSMTDDQITNILEEKRTSTRLKRKSVTRSSTDIKKVKGDDDIATTSKENKEFDSPKLKAKLFSSLSPSFNDSYKEFINSNDNQTKTKKSKEIVKTKIGQFSPKKKVVNTDELKRSPLKPSVTNTKDMIYEVREQDNDCNILVLKI